MEATITAAYLRLYHCKGIGQLQFSRLLKQAGNISALLDSSDEWLQSLLMNPGQISLLRRSQGSASMESKLEEDLCWQQSQGNAIVGYESADYPPLLRTTDFPPPLLLPLATPQFYPPRPWELLAAVKPANMEAVMPIGWRTN